MEDLNSAFHVNNYSVDFNETYHFRIHMFRNINRDNLNNNILLQQGYYSKVDIDISIYNQLKDKLNK